MPNVLEVFTSTDVTDMHFISAGDFIFLVEMSIAEATYQQSIDKRDKGRSFSVVCCVHPAARSLCCVSSAILPSNRIMYLSYINVNDTRLINVPSL